MNDSVPTEDDIKWAVKRLQNHRSGGPSGMRAKQLKGWLATAKRKDMEEADSKKEHPTEERTADGTNGKGAGGDGGEQGTHTYGGIQLGDGGRTRADGVQVGATGGGGHMSGGSPDSQGEKELPWH